MYVMYNGTVMAELETANTTEDEIMYSPRLAGKTIRTGNNRQEGYGSDEKSYKY